MESYEVPNRTLQAVPEPLVTVRTCTYCHAGYIRKCIEGVLQQRTTFSFEYIIGADCCDDGTMEIVLEYAHRYPEKIRVITADQRVGAGENVQRCIRASRGKYAALCEGDDYWTDPLKLEKQITFLEHHPGYSFCCGRFLILDQLSGAVTEKTYTPALPPGPGFTLSMKEMQYDWWIRIMTIAYRRDALEELDQAGYRFRRDVHLFYHLLRSGRGYFFNQVFGVYRRHGGGIYSGQPRAGQIRDSFLAYRELYEKNRDRFTARRCLVFTVALLLRRLMQPKGFRGIAGAPRLFLQLRREWGWLVFRYLPRRIRVECCSAAAVLAGRNRR